MKKIGIDLGNSSIKAAVITKGEVKTTLVKSLATIDSEDTNNIVNIAGQNVYFGVGTPLIENDKTKRKYLEESILLMCYKLYGPGVHEIELGLSLPINLYKLSKELYKSKLEAIGEIMGRVNSDDITCKLKRVEIFAEGLSAFYALQPEIPKENILFIDIGYRTTDTLCIGVEQGKWIMQGSSTLETGAYDMIELLKGPIYEQTGVFFTTSQIEAYLTENRMIGAYDINSSLEVLKPLVEAAMKQIEQLYNDTPVRHLYFIGGGSKLFTSQLEGYRYTLLKNEDKLIYSNSVGNYMKL